MTIDDIQYKINDIATALADAGISSATFTLNNLPNCSIEYRRIDNDNYRYRINDTTQWENDSF